MKFHLDPYTKETTELGDITVFPIGAGTWCVGKLIDGPIEGIHWAAIPGVDYFSTKEEAISKAQEMTKRR